PPLVIFVPPSFAFFVGAPILAFATVGPDWRDGGYVAGGFSAVGAGAAIAHFGHPGPGFGGMPRGFDGRARAPWATTWYGGRFGGGHDGHFGDGHRGGFADRHGGGFGGWHDGG